MKKQNGITLLALVITIVIMLMLAIIAISYVKDTSILSQTEDATSKLNELQKNETALRNELFNGLRPGDDPNEPGIEDNTPDTHICTQGDPVEENKIDATCTVEGSYDEVIYCTVCKVELSRQAKTIPATGHTEGEKKYIYYNEYVHQYSILCTTCEQSIKTSQLIDHTYIDDNTVYTTSKCSDCSFECGNTYIKLENGTTELLYHVWERVSEIESTCTKARK